jgi:hypothetical protein
MIEKCLLSMLVTGVLAAQTTTQPVTPNFAVQLFDQKTAIGSLEQVIVSVCNQTAQPQTVQPLDVWAAVQKLGFLFATNSRLQQEMNSLKGMSAQKKILLAISILGAGFTICDQAQVWKIGSPTEPAQWKTLVSVVATAGPLITVFVSKNVPDTSVDVTTMLPVSAFQLPANWCGQYTMYGTYKAP